MNILLFSSYITTIIVIIVVLLIIIIIWGAYFPKRLKILLITSFVSSIIALIFLFVSELLAPYSSNFYLNPFLYLFYFSLLGIYFFAIFLFITKIFYENNRLIMILGVIIFFFVEFLFTFSEILLLNTKFLVYPLITYIFFESVFGLGIFSYIILTIGSFSYASSNRFEKKMRFGFVVMGIFGLSINYGLSIMALGIFYEDFSKALDVNISIFWLGWISLIAIIFLFFVRAAAKELF